MKGRDHRSHVPNFRRIWSLWYVITGRQNYGGIWGWKSLMES